MRSRRAASGPVFTGNTTALSQFDGHFGLRVVRDCDFAYVGKVPSKLNARLVPCGARKHVNEAGASEGIAGIVTTEELAGEVPAQMGLAIADRPVSATLRIHERLLERKNFQWEDFASLIDETARIHPAAIVEPRNVVIGAHSIIGPGAVICERTIIGENCRIGPGVVIGCDAFEVDLESDPRRVLRQGGGVLLENHVEIEAKSTIVRATFGGFTRIGRETKLDCQIHVAHDCDIGERVRLAACAEISGRVTIGNDAFIGPNCSISNGLQIGENATVTIGSVVVRNVEAGQRVTGNFALPHVKWLSFIKSIR